MDELSLLRQRVEQIREDTVKCPSCMDLWSVLAYDKVLQAIDEMSKKETAARSSNGATTDWDSPIGDFRD